MLLDLKMETRAMSQGIQAVSRAEKAKNQIPPEAYRRSQLCQPLALRDVFWSSDL